MMSKYCKICGKEMQAGGDICRACEEAIRAEATGRQRKGAQLFHKPSDRVGIRDRKEIRKGAEQSGAEEEDTVKKPRDFKSMAEYLEYLKGKK